MSGLTDLDQLLAHLEPSLREGEYAFATAEGGTAVAVADGNLSGTISASKSDVVEGTIHSIDVTAAVATVTVEIAFPEDI